VRSQILAAYAWANELMNDEGQDRQLVTEGLLDMLLGIADGDLIDLDSYTRRYTHKRN
jgi:hypothetical protein